MRRSLFGKTSVHILMRILILDKNSFADPGSVAFLTPGSGMGKKSISGSRMNSRSYFRELRNNFLGKILIFFNADTKSF
jgi:hypothetical protein